MKIKSIIIGMGILAINGATASPRESYLMDKLKEARRIELQAKSKYLAEKGRYKAVAKYKDSLEDELRDVRKRNKRADMQARKAFRAAYLAVDEINLQEMTAPTTIKWRSN